MKTLQTWGGAAAQVWGLALLLFMVASLMVAFVALAIGGIRRVRRWLGRTVAAADRRAAAPDVAPARRVPPPLAVIDQIEAQRRRGRAGAG